jgi:acetoin utilization protein AcuC
MLISFARSKIQLMSKTAVFFGEELAKYGFGETHPFNSNRIYSFWSKFCALNLDKSDHIQIERPEIAKEEFLLRFHDPEYIDLVRQSSKLGTGFLDLGDTPAYRGVFESSCYVVGTSLKALKIVMEKTGGIVHAFNPVGGLHHARRGSAGGFCVFNDIGVVVLLAREKYGIKKIAYVDIDAHHGDGVYYEFENDPELYIADIHEDGQYLYPGTGTESENGSGEGHGTKLNIPMKPNSDDNDFFGEFKRIEEFITNVARPELIIFQCGADGIRGDPLTHLHYSSRAHRLASDVLHRLSHEYSEGRIIALGGGGYNHANIANAWTTVVRSLIEDAS